MSDTVGIAELRQHLTRYLKRGAQGERLIVTDRNRPSPNSALRLRPVRR